MDTSVVLCTSTGTCDEQTVIRVSLCVLAYIFLGVRPTHMAIRNEFLPRSEPPIRRCGASKPRRNVQMTTLKHINHAVSGHSRRMAAKPSRLYAPPSWVSRKLSIFVVRFFRPKSRVIFCQTDVRNANRADSYSPRKNRTAKIDSFRETHDGGAYSLLGLMAIRQLWPETAWLMCCRVVI